MRVLLILMVFAVATTAGAQRVRRYDITIKRLNTAEQQLLHEQRTAIGLKKFEVDKQLREVRKQRLEIQKLRSGVHPSQQDTQRHFTNQRAPRPSTYSYRTPEPDWKTIESPTVQVKGTFKRSGQIVAMVNGGQVVSSNDVFATTYQGETMHWRARKITEWGGDFERINQDGTAYGAEKEEEAAPTPRRRSSGFFARIFGLP